ncbi:uncharacterized protein RAG0_08067 [Rhynchosporium agropyri]|uniref:TauD/TfdA-like domain-containing protein n=1 Tax=Rhynchosporium agropyri TaxID=914238 RepID=A0A1E1KP12_9HELO|nr:uncharacterized protein RAG0_08067 [Rhynchosporium agropyri]
MNRETRRLIQTESTKPSTKNILTTTTPIVLAQALAAKPKETSYSDEPRKTKSDIHSALNERYEVGGILRQGKDTLDRLDEKGLPTWGKWGIPLKLEAWTGSSISALPHFWLRFDFTIPQNIQPKEVRILKEGLQITWANDGHVSTYEWDWLVKHRKNTNIPMTAQEKKRAEEQHIYWDSSIASMPPSVHYDEIMADDTGVGKWTEQIRRFGFCYVEGCPVSPEKTQELLERISFIRVTHYGKLAHISSTTSLTQQGGFYDFTADLTMKDTAYTNLALPAHTDTTYFTDPAGLQMFHLLSHNSGSGGSSLLVDGFHAARTLLRESYSAYEILSKTPISWHASGNEGITITPAKKMPVLTFGDLREGEAPRLLQVRWNNDDRGVVALTEDGGVGAEKWYAAAAKWDEILKRKDMEYRAQLKPGRPLINHDDYISRWRNTNYSRKEALAQIL